MDVVKPTNLHGAEVIENWDDGDFDQFEDINFRTVSSATSLFSHPQANHRDSTSSRMSLRSDSNHGDEHWDVTVDEHASVKDALTIAKSKGIPLPSNLPRSALEGGTIRKLGGRAVKKAIADDWSEDMDFEAASGQLRLAKVDEREFSESLRQISAAFRAGPSSPDDTRFGDPIKSPKSRLAATPLSLEDFRDGEDDIDFVDVPTIRVAKHRSPQKTNTITPANSAPKPSLDDLTEDFELPSDGRLKLSAKRLSPRTPTVDDLDMEWAEGSLGTRNAGRKHAGMSDRSSMFSNIGSPTVSSVFTAESNDDALDELVLPQGPVDFAAILKHKQEQDTRKPSQIVSPSQSRSKSQIAEDEDWAGDLLFPENRAFDSRGSVNRNVKLIRPTSPGKSKSISINISTNLRSGSNTRASRFGAGQERQERQRSHLEPVSETGAPVQRYQRPNSRLGHNAQSSLSNIPVPTPSTPATPSRRELRSSGRLNVQYQPPTTTSQQLLRSKRSMPVMSSLVSPVQGRFPRPPSRQDGTSSRFRPRSPDRERPESRLGSEKRQSAPFLPAGASTSQSQHASTKPSTTLRSRRHDSDESGESMTAAQRSLSRLANTFRPTTPLSHRTNTAELAAQARKTINKPVRRRNYGVGNELDDLDELLVDAAAEAKLTKQPIAKGSRSLRHKMNQTAGTSSTSLASAFDGAETATHQPPASPLRLVEPVSTRSNLPRFAQDTAASRNAREQRSTSTTVHHMRGEPLAPISSNIRPSHATAPSPLPAHLLSKPSYGNSLRRKRSVQTKPYLIKPLSTDSSARPKEEKGMYYNPRLGRWEGNDAALAEFEEAFAHQQDSPTSLHRHPNIKPAGTSHSHTHQVTESPKSSKPNLALIMNIGSTPGVQLVNGMVFDPRQMKWLKVRNHQSASDGIRSGGGSVQLEEEEDVFAGLEDLKEESENMSVFDRPARSRTDSVARPNQNPTTETGNDTTTNTAEDAVPGDRGSTRDDVFILATRTPLPLAQIAKDVFGEEIDELQRVDTDGEKSGDEFAGVAEEFDVGPEFVKRQRSEEERWKRKVAKWLRSESEMVTEAVEGMGMGGVRWALREMLMGSVES